PCWRCSSSRCACSARLRKKRLARLSALDQQLSRRIARSTSIGQSGQRASQLIQPVLIGIVEGTAMEGREPEAEHRAQVPMGRRPNHSSLKHAEALVTEEQDQSVLNLLVVPLSFPAPAAQLVYPRIGHPPLFGQEALDAAGQLALLRPEVEAAAAALADGA